MKSAILSIMLTLTLSSLLVCGAEKPSDATPDKPESKVIRVNQNFWTYRIKLKDVQFEEGVSIAVCQKAAGRCFVVKTGANLLIVVEGKDAESIFKGVKDPVKFLSEIGGVVEVVEVSVSSFAFSNFVMSGTDK